MGQRRRFLAFAAGALAAPAVLRPSRASAAEQMLRLHHFLPPVSNAHANVLTPWAKKIETESQGAIRIRIYPSMQLGGAPPQLFDQARDGVADIVWTLPGYSAGRFPKLETFELPFVAARGGVTNSKAVQDFAVQQARDELREVHLLFAWANDHGVIHATRPIHKQEDLQRRKIRFPTRLVGEALKALGAGAVGMPVPQIPESLAQRAIDGAVVPWEVVPALRLHELVGHHTEFPHAPTFYTSVHVLVMNKARYDGMPAELRQVLDANSGLEPAALAGAAWDKAGAAARQKAQDRGNEVFTLPDDEVARWRQATQPVTDAWVAARPDGAQLLDAARALIARHAQA